MKWRVIDRVPSFKMLDGERERTFVLSYVQERAYLQGAPHPLRDAATLMLDTGLRVGEVLALQWRDIYLEPVGAAKFGYVHVRSGKSKNAKRNVSLTARVRIMLTERTATAKSLQVFADFEGIGPLSIYTLEDQNSRVRKSLGIPECVIHSFRHTFGTRLGEAGTDAFTIRRIMGHSRSHFKTLYNGVNLG
jgi:integrase